MPGARGSHHQRDVFGDGDASGDGDSEVVNAVNVIRCTILEPGSMGGGGDGGGDGGGGDGAAKMTWPTEGTEAPVNEVARAWLTVETSSDVSCDRTFDA